MLWHARGTIQKLLTALERAIALDLESASHHLKKGYLVDLGRFDEATPPLMEATGSGLVTCS